MTFEGGTRLELMSKEGLTEPDHNHYDLAHLAFSLGSKDAVDHLSSYLQEEGYPIQHGSRTTGDGYYEALILDPEGNSIELTI